MILPQKYGVDIATRRIDDLDKKAIACVDAFISAAKKVSVLELGSGRGGLSILLAQPGASVTCVDIEDHSELFTCLRQKHNLREDQLKFVQGDIRNVLPIIDDREHSICVMQRIIHYLPYRDALAILIILKQAEVHRLFISVTGVESDIGRTYKDKNLPVEDRFCSLNASDADIFSINQPICLYTPEEFVALLQESGWEIEECWVSAFGNIKAVCR